MSEENTTQKNEFHAIVRIFSTNIDGNKKAGIGLTKIRGIDVMFSNAVLNVAGIPFDRKIGELSEEEIKKIEEIVKSPSKYNIPSFLYNRRKDPETGEDTHVVGSELRFQNDFDIRRMKRIRSYVGLRHSWHLKVRGQRTKSTGRKGGPAVARKKKIKK